MWRTAFTCATRSCSADVRAEHLSGETPIAEREAILARLASGETEVVSNCMVLTEGWDCPPVSCCVLARPTKQLGLYRQMVGRILRPFEGKTDAVILDHAGAIYRHGLPSDDIDWSLEGGPQGAQRHRGSAPSGEVLTRSRGVRSATPSWAARRRAGRAAGSHDRGRAMSSSSTASWGW